MPKFLPISATQKAYLCLATTAFCWGCNAVFARIAVGEVSPMLVVSLRWCGAVMLLLLFARKPIQRDWHKLKPHIPLLFLMGTLGFTAFNALFYVAAYTTTAVNIGIIQGSIPVFVLVGALFIFRNPVSTLQCLGVVVTVIGVVIVASAGDYEKLTSLSINQGDYFMIVACLLYSAYALTLRQFSHVSSLALFSIIAIAAFISSLPLSVVEFYRGDLQWPTQKGWIVIALITLLPSFIAQICFIKGVSELGPGRAGIFVNLVPVFASILAVSILAEPFKLFHAVALLLVISGIWLAESRKRKSSQVS